MPVCGDVDDFLHLKLVMGGRIDAPGPFADDLFHVLPMLPVTPGPLAGSWSGGLALAQEVRRASEG